MTPAGPGARGRRGRGAPQRERLEARGPGRRLPPLLGRLIRRRRGRWSLYLGIVTAMGYVLPFLPGLLARQVLDRLTGDAPAGLTVPTLLGLLAGMGLAQLAGHLAGAVVGTEQMQESEALVRANLLRGLLAPGQGRRPDGRRPGPEGHAGGTRWGPAGRAAPSPAEALVRFGDDVDAVGMALEFSVDAPGQAFGYLFALAVLARVDAFLTLTVVVPALALLFAANLAAPGIEAARRARQEAAGEASGLLGEALAAVVSIQAAGAEERVVRRFAAVNARRRRAVLGDLLAAETVRSVAANTAPLATGALLLLAGPAARAGRFTAGDLALFTSYLGWLGTVVTYAGHALTTLRQGEVSVARLAALLPGGATGAGAAAALAAEAQGAEAETPATRSRAGCASGHRRVRSPAAAATAVGAVGMGLRGAGRASALRDLEVRGLTAHHPGTGRGVEGVDLHIRRGEFVVVAGRVGSGKTTLLRALLGLMPAEAGEVRWNGKAVRDPGTFLTPPRCAYTPQVPRLLSLPLRDNVRLGLECSDEELDAAARTAVLEDDLAQLEAGWSTAVGPRGRTLSGGQLQRAALARMFVRKADLLVMDDVASALDIRTEGLLWERLGACGDATCLVVSHRLPALQRADRIVVLRAGRVEACGSLAELTRTSAEMRALQGDG